MYALNDRQAALPERLPTCRVITTGRVQALNRALLGAPKRTTARRDIAVLHRQRLLIQGGSRDKRFYLLTRKATQYLNSAREAAS